MHPGKAAVCAAFFSLCANGTAQARPITLPEALALAEGSPTLAVAATEVAEARGNLEQAGTYTYNPALAGAAGPVFGEGGRVYDFEAGISQAIELGGKRAARKRVAAAQRDAAVADLAATRLALYAEVRAAYQRALVAQSRVGVASENEAWARQFLEAARERMRLGAATQTELNVAAAGLGRAIAAHKEAERDLLLARQALGEALGLPGADLEPAGELPTFPAVPADETALVAAALASRADLKVAERLRAARVAGVDLADALAVPDPELSASWIHSGVDDTDAVVAGVRLELPLWNRNQGNRAAARAQRRRAEIELEALRAAIDREVRSAARRYRAATEAVAAFDEQVVGTLAENLKLARETLAAGKLGLLEINNVRRDLVESQLTYLNAIADAVEARAVLERSLGRSLEENP